MRPFRVPIAALIMLAACGGSGDGENGGGNRQADPPGSATSVAPAAFVGATTDVSTPPSSAPPVALLDTIEIGDHPEFERVVFEFTNQVPGYHVGYATGPIIEDGSGDTLTVGGTAKIAVRMEAAAGFDLSGAGQQTYNGSNPIVHNGAIVIELVRSGDFEAVLSWVIGVGSTQPFNVTTLTSPPRLVIDIKKP